ncbi:MAG TPA: ABC transporter permease [Gaiellaceae bacterium]|jgi:peptide/nickel transport system permease protein|nr:ABC transporter permease [Gaiellaceae bacterium]
MTRLILVRVAIAALTFWGASVLIYIGIAALPGSPAEAVLGPEASPESIASLSQQMGLDHPLVERYGIWFGHFIKGDMGNSFATGAARPVWPLIKHRVIYSLALALATLVFLIPISIGLGVISAVRRGGTVDNVIMSSTLTFVAMPEFVVGTVLVLILAVWLGWFPAVSLINPAKSVFLQPKFLVLPVLTLLFHSVAGTTRMVRACLIDVLRSEYVEMARLKGLSERRVLLHHALPNALGPTIQILALNAASLVGGIVVVETVFGYPGLGSYLTSAVQSYDVATVEAIGLLITAAYVIMNMIAGLSVVLLNPRVRRGQ